MKYEHPGEGEREPESFSCQEKGSLIGEHSTWAKAARGNKKQWCHTVSEALYRKGAFSHFPLPRGTSLLPDEVAPGKVSIVVHGTAGGCFYKETHTW